VENPVLARLAATGQVRQGAAAVAPVHQAIPSSYPVLDALLGGGWPAGLLLEFLVSPPGGGELALLLPALARLHAADAEPVRHILLIAPPHVPYPPALQDGGVDLRRVLVVPPSRRLKPADVLWTMEEALAAGACAAVLAWGGDAGRTALQRLQLAALASEALAVLVRGARHRRERSPAAIRLELQAMVSGSLSVEVFRNRHGPTGRVDLLLPGHAR
jgi:cell division inhibitor SulA/protein ImuA